MPEPDPTRDPAIAVWLIEDNPTFRTTVRRVIDQSDGLACPRDFANCEDALAALGRGDAPDIVLLDVGLPGMDGIQGIREIKARSPDVHLIQVIGSRSPHEKFRLPSPRPPRFPAPGARRRGPRRRRSSASESRQLRPS